MKLSHWNRICQCVRQFRRSISSCRRHFVWTGLCTGSSWIWMRAPGCRSGRRRSTRRTSTCARRTAPLCSSTLHDSNRQRSRRCRWRAYAAYRIRLQPVWPYNRMLAPGGRNVHILVLVRILSEIWKRWRVSSPFSRDLEERMPYLVSAGTWDASFVNQGTRTVTIVANARVVGIEQRVVPIVDSCGGLGHKVRTNEQEATFRN